ncbi:MAG TPA: hypothetical protein VLB73_04375 [Patescibacteria group bacterium]|nr:hypothetical protein [Patescibacteria group bacterium]
MRHFLTSQSGQTLIEVLVALTAGVVIIAAIVSASLNALTNSNFARDQNIAAQYTQSGIEIIRDMRNESIASLSASYLSDNTYCLAKSCSALDNQIPSCWIKSGNCGQNVDKFVREVVVAHDSSDCNASPTPNGQQGFLSSNVKVTVTTFWYDSRCTDSSNAFCHSVTLSSCFSDFTIAPTP